MFKETVILSTIIFVISLVLCYLPSKIKSVDLLKKIYPYITIAAAGFMLAMLLMDFIPHLSGTCAHHNKNKKNHTLDECQDAMKCDIHKKYKLSSKNKSHTHDGHSHTHDDPSHCSHDHTHPDLSFFAKNFGFFIAGISFIFLLAIDSLLLQHSHCDNEGVVYMNDGLNHGAHQHEYCHLHEENEIKDIAKNQISHSEEISRKEEVKEECDTDKYGTQSEHKHIYETDNQKRENKENERLHASNEAMMNKKSDEVSNQGRENHEKKSSHRHNEANTIQSKETPHSHSNKEKQKSCNETKIHIESNEDTHFHLDGGCNTTALKDKKGKLQAMIFIIALSVHSLFEGFAIKTHEIGIFEIGIILHKALESFALGFTVWMATFSYNFKIILMTIYSLLTPLGMFISYLLQKLPINKNSQKFQYLLKATCNGLALGSILFIVCVEMIPPNFHSKGANFSKVFTLCAGYLLTCIVIYFIH